MAKGSKSGRRSTSDSNSTASRRLHAGPQRPFTPVSTPQSDRVLRGLSLPPREAFLSSKPDLTVEGRRATIRPHLVAPKGKETVYGTGPRHLPPAQRAQDRAQNAAYQAKRRSGTLPLGQLVRAFHAPSKVLLCIKRKIRKEIIHAKGKAGSRTRTPRFTLNSRIKC